ncbi:MAG: hypothetical protein JWP58_3123 [Hymenobacter sp.]|nr:hypothetical protein [Hymenobacter sp.]
MHLQRQPRGSKICGHCCVAMVTGASLQEVIAQVGHRHGTSARELGTALRAFGHQAHFKLTGFKKEASLPPRCILKQLWTSGEPGHWVVYDAGTIYCPGHGTYPYAEAVARTGGRFTAYLKLTFF